MTGKPGDALSSIPGLAHSPAGLSLSGPTHLRDIDLPEAHNDHRSHLERDAPNEAVGEHSTNAMEVMSTQLYPATPIMAL